MQFATGRPGSLPRGPAGVAAGRGQPGARRGSRLRRLAAAGSVLAMTATVGRGRGRHRHGRPRADVDKQVLDELAPQRQRQVHGLPQREGRALRSGRHQVEDRPDPARLPAAHGDRHEEPGRPARSCSPGTRSTSRRSGSPTPWWSPATGACSTRSPPGRRSRRSRRSRLGAADRADRDRPKAAGDHGRRVGRREHQRAAGVDASSACAVRASSSRTSTPASTSTTRRWSASTAATSATAPSTTTTTGSTRRSVCGSPSLAPCDNNDHGTHTMGTMVGDDGAGNQIGVAPGAKWIAAKGCETNTCSDAALLASGQWILAPTDLNGQQPAAGPAPRHREQLVGRRHPTTRGTATSCGPGRAPASSRRSPTATTGPALRHRRLARRLRRVVRRRRLRHQQRHLRRSPAAGDPAEPASSRTSRRPA